MARAVLQCSHGTIGDCGQGLSIASDCRHRKVQGRTGDTGSNRGVRRGDGDGRRASSEPGSIQRIVTGLHRPAALFLLPNTAGCYTAEEAIRAARLAREVGISDWVKIEVIGDRRRCIRTCGHSRSDPGFGERRLYSSAVYFRRHCICEEAHRRGRGGGHAARGAHRQRFGAAELGDTSHPA